MKRREFLQNAGLGASGLLITPGFIDKKPAKKINIDILRKPVLLSELVNRDGFVRLRMEFKNHTDKGFDNILKSIDVKNAGLEGIKEYFFQRSPEAEMIRLTPDPTVNGIIVLLLKDASEKSQVRFKLGGKKISINLGELLKESEITTLDNEKTVITNYLLDREIALLDPEKAGIKPQGDNYSFAVMADPQGGNPANSTRIKINNTWVEESVKLVNSHASAPLFTLMVGDIVDGQGQEDDFSHMGGFFSKLKTPVLYEIGNHESKYSAKFEPGYNHESLKNYYTAQKAINGTELLLYSFNMGRWHYIVWPDPLRSTFFERHPHYFEWLEKDLEQHKDRPVMVFHHVPAHPIGIDPLTEYAEAPYVKKMLTSILSKHGNVKYVLSGHVHIPLRAAIKTAVEYKGMKFINLPAAGYRPRGFGEEDLYGGVTEGVVFVHVEGENTKIEFKNVMEDSYFFPEKLRKFDETEFPLWFNYRWELGKNKGLMNGDFTRDLKYWMKRYIFMEDSDPSNICRVVDESGSDSGKALYLYNRKRGFDTAGQDRLPQTLNRLAQIISIPEGKLPVLRLKMKPGSNYKPESRNGIYIWIEGYKKSIKRLNITYSAGYHYWHLERNYSQHNFLPPVRMEVSTDAMKWHKLDLNPYADFRKFSDSPTDPIPSIDRLIINLGVWTINDGYDQKTDVYFSDLALELKEPDHSGPSQIDGIEIAKKDDSFMVWGGTKHVGGEHITWRTDMNFYGKDI